MLTDVHRICNKELLVRKHFISFLALHSIKTNGPSQLQVLWERWVLISILDNTVSVFTKKLTIFTMISSEIKSYQVKFYGKIWWFAFHRNKHAELIPHAFSVEKWNYIFFWLTTTFHIGSFQQILNPHNCHFDTW